MKQRTFKEKSPLALKQLIAAGGEYVDHTYLIQMLTETEKVTRDIIGELHSTIDEFKRQGGTYWVEDSQVYFKLKNSSLTLTHNEDGDDYYSTDIRFKDQCVDLLYETAVAVYKIPRMEFVLETIPQLISYVENCDALEGGRDLQALVKQNDTLAVEILKGAVALQEDE